MAGDEPNRLLALARAKLPAEKFDHSVRVAQLADKQGSEYGVVGLMHEMFEDSDISEAALLDAGITDDQLTAIRLLTRGPEPYEEYVEAIVRSGNRVAISVKLCDLLDHLDPAFNAGLTLEKQERYLAALPDLLDALHNTTPPVT